MSKGLHHVKHISKQTPCGPQSAMLPVPTPQHAAEIGPSVAHQVASPEAPRDARHEPRSDAGRSKKQRMDSVGSFDALTPTVDLSSRVAVHVASFRSSRSMRIRALQSACHHGLRCMWRCFVSVVLFGFGRQLLWSRFVRPSCTDRGPGKDPEDSSIGWRPASGACEKASVDARARVSGMPCRAHCSCYVSAA